MQGEWGIDRWGGIIRKPFLNITDTETAPRLKIATA